MPLYEYQCSECGGINTALILKPREEEDPQPDDGRQLLDRLLLRPLLSGFHPPFQDLRIVTKEIAGG